MTKVNYYSLFYYDKIQGALPPDGPLALEETAEAGRSLSPSSALLPWSKT
jgi:hypothetical protein